MRLGLLRCDEIDERFRDLAPSALDLYRWTFESEGVTLVDYDVLAGELPDDPTECDGWIITGSRASVYDDETWIHDLAASVRRLHTARAPIIGICFGHQLLAHALGGETARSEQGWGIGAREIETRVEGLPSPVSLLMSHQDQVVRLPPSARVLGSAEYCPNAIFAIGEHAVGVQGHPEFTPEYMAALLRSRIERIGAEPVAEALESLDEETHGREVAAWLVDFVRRARGRQRTDD